LIDSLSLSLYVGGVGAGTSEGQLALDTVEQQATHLAAHALSDRPGHAGDRFHRIVDVAALYAAVGVRRGNDESAGTSLSLFLSLWAARPDRRPGRGAEAFVGRLRAAAEAVLHALNQGPYARYDALVARILSNVRNRLHYERLAEHGPRLGPISADCPVVATYFTRLPVPDHDQVCVACAASAGSGSVCACVCLALCVLSLTRIGGERAERAGQRRVLHGLEQWLDI
jgi:hypothetical protein